MKYLEANLKSLVDHDEAPIDGEIDPERWLKFAAWKNHATTWLGKVNDTPKMPRTDFMSVMHHTNTRPAADLNESELIEFKTILMTIAAVGEQVKELGAEIHEAIEILQTQSPALQADLQNQIEDLKMLRRSSEQEHSRLARRLLWLRVIRNKDLLTFIYGANQKND